MGRRETLGFGLRREAGLETLVEDVVRSSDRDPTRRRSARRSRRLGMVADGVGPVDRDVEGVLELVLDATGRFDHPLIAERLFDWHASLLPTGRSGMRRIAVGRGRDERARYDRSHVVDDVASRLTLNERQRRVLKGVLDGFEGKFTTSKWAKLAKCSQDPALRDVTVLVEHGLLTRLVTDA